MHVTQGELWSTSDRLVYDWGYAGYQGGAVPPLLPVTVNLKTQYGARGDGVTDDTQALLSAINDITKGVIYMPAGEAQGLYALKIGPPPQLSYPCMCHTDVTW